MDLENKSWVWLVSLFLFDSVLSQTLPASSEQNGGSGPSAIRISVYIRTPYSIVLGINKSSSVDPEIEQYLVRYSPDNGLTWSQTMTFAASEPSFTLDNLTPYTTYTVEVLASGGRYTSPPVGIVQVRTTEIIPEPPEDVHVEHINSTSVIIRWKKPSRPNGIIVGYTVRLLYSDSSGMPFTVRANVFELLLKELKPAENFIARVSAMTKFGLSPFTQVHFTTQAEKIKDTVEDSENVTLPELPFQIPKRLTGFVYKDTMTNAQLNLEVFLDLTCPVSRDAWPPLKRLVESYSLDKLRLTVNFFALPYFNNAFIFLKSAFVVAAYNSSFLFPWVDTVFENQEYISNTAKKGEVDVLEIIQDLANSTNISPSVMKTRLNDDKKLEWQARVAWKYACSRGVLGTPTFFMNGVYIAGESSASWTEQQWHGLIKKLLN